MLKSLDRTTSAHREHARRRVSLSEVLVRRFIGPAAAGRLLVQLPSDETFVIGRDTPGARADVTVHRGRALWRMFTGGDVALAEAYRDGDWTTSDLYALLNWGMQNEAALYAATSGLTAPRGLRYLQHQLRTNTRGNSRRNIAAHYDLGNEFYAAWLDDGMQYSSGIYAGADTALAAAQQTKLERIAALLDLKGGEGVLEIGCGWGALAEHLIAVHGCHVTGLTLSERQRDYARARLNRSGLGAQADIRLQDYRDVEGTYDRIVSIEMLEAVGEAYWPQYFAKLRQCLAPGGSAVLQVICIAPDRYRYYRQRPDFIQTHIFPGGALPTADIVLGQAERVGLKTLSVEMFGASYARTLAEWRQRFNSAWPAISEMGFDERFRRLWNYYLAYCEVGFEHGALDVGLFRLEQPR
jgi:cyclopropane-fatty-acyl-phospholipid synthase